MTQPQSTNDLSHVRDDIDAADKEIGKTLLSVAFAVVSEPQTDLSNDDIPEQARELLDEYFVPHDLIMAVVKYVDLTKLDGEQKKGLFLNLSSSLMDRYYTVLEVASVKKEHGETSAYHEARHNQVIENYRAFAADDKRLSGIFADIGRDIADKMTNYQNTYLNEEVDFSAPADTYREKNPISYTEARKIRAAILEA